MNKKSISTIVAVVLLLFVLIGIFFTTFNWFGSFQSNLFSNANENDKSIELGDYEDNIIYVRNFESYSINYTQIKIGDINCGLSGEIIPNQYTQINISTCVLLVGEANPKEIVIFTENKIYSKVYMIGED